MPCCILFKDLIPFSLLFLGLGCFSCVTKALDLEEIIIGHFDVEGDSTKKVKRVIHSTSII
jgi:hypothetical protein